MHQKVCDAEILSNRVEKSAADIPNLRNRTGLPTTFNCFELILIDYFSLNVALKGPGRTPENWSWPQIVWRCFVHQGGKHPRFSPLKLLSTFVIRKEPHYIRGYLLYSSQYLQVRCETIRTRPFLAPTGVFFRLPKLALAMFAAHNYSIFHIHQF